MPGILSERDPQVMIPSSQRDLHIASEWIALVVAVPALAWIALNPQVPRTARNIAGAVALATFIVDGSLLMRWYRR
jgi:hypothetical protein